MFLLTHLNKAGMQRAVSNISQGLPKDIYQYVGFFGTDTPPFLFNAVMHDFDVSGVSGTGFFTKLRNFLIRLKKLRQFVRLNKIDTVVSFGEAANLINILSFHQAKCISSIRVALGVYDQKTIYNRIYKAMIRLVYPLSDAIVACSIELKSQIEQVTKKSVPVYNIPNLYHIDIIRERAADSISDDLEKFCDSPFVLCVGSIQPRKGQTLLIDAFSLISKKLPELKLLIIGEGPDVGKCHELLRVRGLDKLVKIIPFDPNPYRYMKRAVLFVLPSSAEGFPNVLLESMACGCPVVAFDCPTGPREIIGESEFGELIEKSSVNELADTIETLLSSPIRLEHLRHQSIRRAADYDSANVILQWVEVLKKHA